ncbi:hypothetical protein D2V93_08520 [Flagellimonas taeanensis]|uniref:hypothetical protein n=1 Tax=Flagellimonas taeanensis TaxID=1005926 RepID=UPI000E6854F5|nr:hypothetical protein [Allomuricauda taeanensis]RIV50905.1 hypothetical protein D2V93_08520 [Allomuricauda taeanensis]
MKTLDLRTEFKEQYQGSNLQKIVRNNPIPIKYTIEGIDCYFFNPDLFGLMDFKIKKDGLTPDDFAIDYKDGFQDGLLHLREKEEITVKDLRNKDFREEAIQQLKRILYEREFKRHTKGLLELVFKTTPRIFTKKTIYNHGYWNAIVYSIDELGEIAGLEIGELQNQNVKTEYEEKKTLTHQQTEKPKSELSLRQIALIYVYSDKQITEHNGNEIAKEYGWTSGRKLWQHFNFYYKKVNRKGLDATEKKTKNKIKLIESVVELLPTDKQEKAKDEVSILKKIYEAEYQ